MEPLLKKTKLSSPNKSTEGGMGKEFPVVTSVSSDEDQKLSTAPLDKRKRKLRPLPGDGEGEMKAGRASQMPSPLQQPQQSHEFNVRKAVGQVKDNEMRTESFSQPEDADQKAILQEQNVGRAPVSMPSGESDSETGKLIQQQPATSNHVQFNDGQSVSKSWHHEVTQDVRDNLVSKLVTAILPTPMNLEEKQKRVERAQQEMQPNIEGNTMMGTSQPVSFHSSDGGPSQIGQPYGFMPSSSALSRLGMLSPEAHAGAGASTVFPPSSVFSFTPMQLREHGIWGPAGTLPGDEENEMTAGGAPQIPSQQPQQSHEFNDRASVGQLGDNMEQRGLGLDADDQSPTRSPHEQRELSIQRCIQSLAHACQCRDSSCRLQGCMKMKRAVQHNKSCKRKTNGGCPICRQLIALCCCHAKRCTEVKCPVPFCQNIKQKLQLMQQKVQQGLKLVDGMVKVARVRLNIVGQDGVGKSSFIRLLLKKKFDDLASTCGIDVSNARVNVIRSHAASSDGGLEWQSLDCKQLKELLGDYFAKATVEVEREVLFEEKEHSTEGGSSSGNDTERNSSGGSSSQDVDHVDLPKEHLRKIKAIINDPSRVGPQGYIILLTICDFGGQEPFLQSHAALMPSGSLSVYMLVFNGAELLSDKAESFFREVEGNSIAKSQQKLCRMKINGDFLKFWSSSVHIAHASPSIPQSEITGSECAMECAEAEDACYLGKTEEVIFPAVFLTATHREEAEKKTDSNGRSYLELNDQYIKEAFFQTECQSHFVEVPTKYREDHDYQFQFFAVENSTSGTEQEDPLAKEIRGKIEEMTTSFWEDQEPQPARWLKFEDALGELKKITGRSVSNMSYVKEVAKVCEIHTEEDLANVLKHLTDVAAAFHFPEVPDLGNWIFHDIPWLINVLSSSVGSVHVKPTPRLKNDWQCAIANGFLTKRLVHFFLKKAKVQNDDFDLAKAILGQFDVVTPHDQGFISPCFLQDQYEEEPAYCKAFTGFQTALLPLPLIIHPRDVPFFPEPLFFRLITRLFRGFQQDPNYRMDFSSDQRRNRFICHGDGIEAEFLYQCDGKESHSGSFIAVTISGADEKSGLSAEQLGKIPHWCNKLRELLIENVMKAKQRGMAGFQYGFFCRVLGDEASDCSLTELVDPTKQIPLAGRKQLGSVELSRMKLWFAESDGHQDGSSQATEDDLRSNAEPVSEHKEIVDAVVKHCSDKWLPFGEALGYTNAQVKNFACQSADNECKLRDVIYGWTSDQGDKATVKCLLDASDRAHRKGVVEEEIKR